jgi:hypothetical protein
MASLPPDSAGWLAGLRDRLVGRALALLHEHPLKYINPPPTFTDQSQRFGSHMH